MPRLLFARLLLLVAALPQAYFGVAYLVHRFAGAGWAAAYHQRLAGGIEAAALAPPVAALYTTLVGVLGALWLALGIGNVLLAFALTRARAEPGAWIATLGLNLVAGGALIAVNRAAGTNSPWWMNLIVLLIVLTGLALAYRARPD
jgi:hypothetical protein